jgi:C4-dicarboxylate transporter
MKNEIRKKSLMETQLENESEQNRTINNLLILVFILTLIGVVINVFQSVINWSQIGLSMIVLIGLLYFFIKLSSIQSNIKKIKNQLYKLKDKSIKADIN